MPWPAARRGERGRRAADSLSDLYASAPAGASNFYVAATKFLVQPSITPPRAVGNMRNSRIPSHHKTPALTRASPRDYTAGQFFEQLGWLLLVCLLLGLFARLLFG